MMRTKYSTRKRGKKLEKAKPNNCGGINSIPTQDSPPAALRYYPWKKRGMRMSSWPSWLFVFHALPLVGSLVGSLVVSLVGLESQ